jgi:hypothetical protein
MTSGLWFLGYQPDSWETRLLAKILQAQRGNARCESDHALVIQEENNSFAELFWNSSDCDYYPEISLQGFIDKIKENLSITK